jgi:hypothetical protein
MYYVLNAIGDLKIAYRISNIISASASLSRCALLKITSNFV